MTKLSSFLLIFCRRMVQLLWQIGLLGMLTPNILGLMVQYDGDQVLKIIPQTYEQVHHVQNLCEAWSLDLWKPHLPESIRVEAEVHVRVPASALEQIKESLLQNVIPFQVLIEDVQELLNNGPGWNPGKYRNSLLEYDYTKYHPMDEIYRWMDQIKNEYSQLVTQNYLGATYESRPMYYLKISQPSNKPKKIIWMDCGIHAREWISPAFCQWFVKEILKNHQSDPKLSKALQNIDIYVLPVLNIDGYIYTWTTDRLWRKSRSPHENGTCFGVDLNRNFNSQWCTVDAESFCSSSAYCGTSPASEPETKAVTSFIESQKSDVLCYLSIHSYSQLILIPYAYSIQAANNHVEMMELSLKAAAALKERHGTDYKVGPFSTVLYYASGTSQDWAHDLGIEFSFTFELRDNGTYGFRLPEDQIQPTCEETMAAVKTILDYIDEKYFKNHAVTATSTALWLTVLLSAS